jgi:NTE family protein/lysophospholipid hydrolase
MVSNRNLLVDGGVLNNLPIDIMRELCSGTVIAINVSPEKDLKLEYERFPSPWRVLWNRIIPFKRPLSVPNIFDLLMRTTMVGSIYKTHAVKVHADLYLQPPLNQFKLLDFKSFDQIVDVGYEYAKQKLMDFRLAIDD